MGIFGVGYASYWYGQIAGSGTHLMYEMFGPEMQLLVFTDNLETELNQVDGGASLAFLYLSTLGFPFKWVKQRGGVHVT